MAIRKAVMIVDDDKHVRFTVRELFERNGFEVTAADGADECIAKLEAGFRGVILMDIMMPGADGWDAIRMMLDRGLYDGNVVAMLTARDVPDAKMDGLQEYVTDYITKPFEPDELVDIVTGYLNLLSPGGDGK